MNDDMLLVGKVSPADFYSSLYGSVFRIDTSARLNVQSSISSQDIASSGEWGGLHHANSLLSTRFPNRARHYLHHLPKTTSLSMFREAYRMFGQDLDFAATRPFRESIRGHGDIEIGFLIPYLRMERWREALLWSWTVARMGSLDDSQPGNWSEPARQELIRVLKVDSLGLNSSVEVTRPVRNSHDDLNANFERMGWTPPLATKYTWSSMDGHSPAQDGKSTCQIDIAQCFGEAFVVRNASVSAADVFQRIAFDQWACGDCGESIPFR